MQSSEGENQDFLKITRYVPLIKKDNTTGGGIVTSDQIRSLPTKSVNGLATTVQGFNNGDDLSVRSGRGRTDIYYIDCYRVRNKNNTVDYFQVKLGGLEADKSN